MGLRIHTKARMGSGPNEEVFVAEGHREDAPVEPDGAEEAHRETDAIYPNLTLTKTFSGLHPKEKSIEN